MIIYSPSTCSKHVRTCLSFSYWTQDKLFWRMLVKLTVVIDFHSMEKYTMVKLNGYRQLFGYQHSSKYLLVYSTEVRNTYRIRTSGGWINYDNFHFWVNYPFKEMCFQIKESTSSWRGTLVLLFWSHYAPPPLPSLPPSLPPFYPLLSSPAKIKRWLHRQSQPCLCKVITTRPPIPPVLMMHEK